MNQNYSNLLEANSITWLRARALVLLWKALLSPQIESSREVHQLFSSEAEVTEITLEETN